MRSTQLRIYDGPDGDQRSLNLAEVAHARQTVTVPLADVLPLLADAAESKRTWLRDFEDDEITVSMDLYEVLLAYRHYRRPSA